MSLSGFKGVFAMATAMATAAVVFMDTRRDRGHADNNRRFSRSTVQLVYPRDPDLVLSPDRGRFICAGASRLYLRVPGSSRGSVHALCTGPGGWAVGSMSAGTEQQVVAATSPGSGPDAWICRVRWSLRSTHCGTRQPGRCPYRRATFMSERGPAC